MGMVTALALFIIIVGCAPASEQVSKMAATTSAPGQTLMRVTGMLPGLDLEDMVRLSDAVVIGTFVEHIGTKRMPGEVDDPPRFYDEFKEYEMTIESSLYPESGIPDSIAVLVHTGVVGRDSSVKIVGSERPRNFLEGDKVLLFLESLNHDKFGETVKHEVPKGFTIDDYYRVIMGASIGKLAPDGDKWTDTYSRKTVSIDDILSAIESQKGNSS